MVWNTNVLESVDWYKFTSSSTFKLAIGFSPGGALQLHLYRGVWRQDWKIDPSAD